MNVIGLDPSATSSGVVVLSPQLEVLHAAAITPASDGPARLRQIYNDVAEVSARFGPFAAAVREDYAILATNRPYLLGEVGGVTQAAVYPHTKALYACAPKALKKFLSGNASATKADMRVAAQSRYGFDSDCDDIVDAYGLARIAATLAGYASPVYRPSLEVVYAIRQAAAGGAPKPRRAPRTRRQGVGDAEVC